MMLGGTEYRIGNLKGKGRILGSKYKVFTRNVVSRMELFGAEP